MPFLIARSAKPVISLHPDLRAPRQQVATSSSCTVRLAERALNLISILAAK